MKIIKNYLTLLNFILTFPLLVFSQEKTLYNTLDEILQCKDKIELKLHKVWGDEGMNSIEQAFYIPADIEIDKQGNVYILDRGNNRIQVFDSMGNYMRTIGRAGKGPGDFLEPLDMELNKNNNLLVCDGLNNRRIQYLNYFGKYLGGFKILDRYPGEIKIIENDLILMSNYKPNFNKQTPLLLIYNNKGQIIEKIGINKYVYENRNSVEGIYFSLDNEGNIYSAYYTHAIIQKHSKNGELKFTSTYEMPFKIPIPKRIGKYGEMQGQRILFGLSIDSEDRVYLSIITRLMTKKEKKIGTSISSFSKSGDISDTIYLPNDLDSDTTDLYQILVFNNSGKIIASKKLNVYCENIKVHKDRLFVIDSYVGMKIYEYKIIFE